LFSIQTGHPLTVSELSQYLNNHPANEKEAIFFVRRNKFIFNGIFVTAWLT
jgi:hypothetical protein